jgi:hypothetical protein
MSNDELFKRRGPRDERFEGLRDFSPSPSPLDLRGGFGPVSPLVVDAVTDDAADTLLPVS